MYDILFCSLPYSNLDHIYSAPAILKGVVKENGYTAKTVDFGCTLLKLCNNDTEVFDRVQGYFISPVTFDRHPDQPIIEQFYNHVIKYFQENPSRYIGLSVFSVYTQKCTFELLERMKSAQIAGQVIIGGLGAGVPIYPSIVSNIRPQGSEKLLNFAEFLKKRNLIDHYVIGDGEDAVLAILNNKTPTTDTSEVFRYPLPDYSDYNFDDYLFDRSEINLPITGSKGCVRDCDFCTVKHHFGRYRYRNGLDIAREMIEVSQQLGIRKFQFTDSLVNGGLKPFEEFVGTLAEYNRNNPDKTISWNGQYICRPANQMPQHLYPLMAESGAQGLTIGAESGSNRVLAAMNKKTTVEALYHELEQFRRYGITCMILTFPGHWSETWEDFVDHCRMFVRIMPYVRSGTISAVSMGFLFEIPDGTPSFDNHEKNSIVLSEIDRGKVWYVKNNPGNTFKERVYRRLVLEQLAQKLRIPTTGDYEVFALTANTIELQHKEINKFYEQFA